ncbi:efflux RND transporter periplasmic adaptor subunit [Herminiimonas arsenitoxidans]|uniref:efflux RND transporter periplasmic adaptor subunit n=1 Tax=Herminiimonas arsenitoxidans TaxID=1809410 RepID=UPI0009F9C87C|nr:efflux RND transporter periplasmic adaptor subunit [Herminiimonas arsenitoxidans]
MTEERHANIGIQGLQAHGAARGIHRLRLLGRVQKFALLIVCVLIIGAAIVIGLRFAKASELADVSKQQAMRYVTVVNPRDAAADNLLRLPGTLQGAIEAPIYARTNGYVTRWVKDIGDPVKRGDLLALIDTPEVAQQLNEAKATQAQAVTNLQLAKSTFERWDALRKRDAVSQQDLDEKRNTLAVAVAADNSAKATVQRLQDQLGYSRVIAPFDGIVTRRNIDIGTLIDAGGGARVLFTMAKSDPLRVHIYVPQGYSTQIKTGDKVGITLTEIPGKVFEGSIARTAGAIDTLTRTLQVVVDLPNPNGELLPGAYVQVAVKANGSGTGALTIPSNALLFRPEGTRVAIVNDGKVHLQPVVIGRELGVDVELASGVKAQDKLIINPSDSLSEGDAVSVIVPKDAKPASGNTAPKGKAS